MSDGLICTLIYIYDKWSNIFASQTIRSETARWFAFPRGAEKCSTRMLQARNLKNLNNIPAASDQTYVVAAGIQIKWNQTVFVKEFTFKSWNFI